MPYSSDPNDYPNEFLALFNKVLSKGEAIRLDLPTSGDAINLRQRLYSFRKALQKSNLPDTQRYFDLSIQQKDKTVRIFINGALDAIRQQLGEDSNQTTIDQDDFDEYLKQLEQFDGTQEDQDN